MAEHPPPPRRAAPRFADRKTPVALSFGHPDSAPALRTDVTFDGQAGPWWLEQGTIVAALASMRSVLISDRCLRHLGRHCMVRRRAEDRRNTRNKCHPLQHGTPREL